MASDGKTYSPPDFEVVRSRLRDDIMARRAERKGKPYTRQQSDDEWYAAQERLPKPQIKWESERRPQQVYFIQAADGSVKIGIAADPASRLATLQIAHAHPLKLLATCPGGAMREKAYHEHFASARLAGEWFSPAPEILAEITRLQQEKVS